jgi:hypothetical protein
MSITPRRQAFRIARTLRERFRAGGEFDHGSYVAALEPALREFEAEAFRGFVLHVAEHIDKDATRERTPEGQGELFDLEGEYKLGDSRRVAKAMATVEHADKAMSLDDANLEQVVAANLRKRKELFLLRPFWNHPGVTKAEAVTAYNAASRG